VRVAVLNGPNLNLLGAREPQLYGTETLQDIERMVRQLAATKGIELIWHQTNHEGELVEQVHELKGFAHGALVNAAAYTHTSIAVRDALLAVQIPFVEVHLSNIFARETERRHSLLADIAIGVVAGFGANSYLLGLDALLHHLSGSAA
jgi:3-dehydroquinate dehydratase-2